MRHYSCDIHCANIEVITWIQDVNSTYIRRSKIAQDLRSVLMVRGVRKKQ